MKRICGLQRWFSAACAILMLGPCGSAFAAGELGRAGNSAPGGRVLPKEGSRAHARLFISPGSTGTAHFAVPIQIPADRKGVTPELSLNYSSEGGPSWVGLGWSLDLGKVERSGNGKPAPDFNGNDAFVVNAAGLLSYLVYDGGASFYKTEEESWNRVDKISSDNTWTLRSSGKTYEFKQKAGSIVNGSYQSDGDRLREWALTRVLDEDNNEIQFTYTAVDTGTGAYYPDKIFYVVNNGQDSKRAVVFNLEASDRPDPILEGRLGKVEIRRRLDSLDVYSQWNGSAANSILFKRYDLQYTRNQPSYPASCNPYSTCAPVDADCNVCNTGSCPANSCYYCDDKPNSSPGAKRANWGSGDSQLTKVVELVPSDDAPGRSPTVTAATWEFSYAEKIPGFDNEERNPYSGLMLDFVKNAPARAGSYDPYYQDLGRRVADVNGDGCADIVYSAADCSGNVTASSVMLGDCQGGFANAGWTVPEAFVIPQTCSGSLGYRDLGVNLEDINGDGRSDLIVARKNCDGSGVRKVYLNHGSGWTYDSAWSSNFPSDAYFIEYGCSSGNINKVYPYGLTFANLNGDPFPDIILNSHRHTASKYVAFNRARTNPGSWDKQTTGLGAVPERTSHRAFQMGDVNGDGLADILYSYVDDKNNSNPDDDTYVSNVYLNIAGKSWELRSDLSNDSFPFIFAAIDYAAGGGANNQKRLDGTVIDMNGDGRVDLVDNFNVWLNCYNCSGTYNKWINTAVEMYPDQIDYTGGPLGKPGETPWDIGTRFWDGNGDGVVDVFNFNNLGRCYENAESGNGQERYLGSGSRSGMAPAGNLLTQVKTPLGARISYYYRPSTAYDNSHGSGVSQLPIVKNVVSRMEIDDGRGQPTSVISTTFEYAGGLFKMSEGAFYGFETVSEIDAAGNRHATTYYQDDILRGKVKSETWKNAAGKIFKAAEYTYTTDGQDPSCGGSANLDCTAPYFNPLRRTVEKIYDLADSPRYQLAITYEYALNSSGLLDSKTEKYWGFDDGTLNESYPADNPDQRTVITRFVHNAGSSPLRWLVNLPGKMRIYSGIAHSFDDPWLREFETIYDDGDGQYNGNERWDAVPQSSRDLRFVTRGADSRETVTEKQYDTSGNFFNLLQVKGQGGETTLLRHGGDCSSGSSVNNGVYLTDVCDPAQRHLQYTYNVHGQMKQVSDLANRLDSLREFDAAHRLKAVYSGKSGAVKLVEEVDRYYEGQPQNQYEEQRRNIDDVQKSALRTYRDGLGRVYKQISLGTASDRDEIVETVYDALGRVQKSSRPYFRKDGAGLWSEVEYDGLGRPVKTYNAESGSNRSYATVSYAGNVNTATDEEGNRREYRYDAYGNLEQVTQYLKNLGSEQPLVTRYQYDALNNLTAVIDAEGRIITRNTYDGLGRLVQSSDVHAGAWQYTYNSAGLMTSQKDPNGNIARLTYDSLRRVTKKEYWKPGGSKPALIDLYYYDRGSDGQAHGASYGRLVEAVSQENVSVPDPDHPGYLKYVLQEHARSLSDYDDRGRVQVLTQTIEGETLKTKYDYNAADAPSRQTRYYDPAHPEQQDVADFTYDAAGYLASVTATRGVAAAQTLLSGIQRNAQGQVTQEALGNGLVNHFSFNPNARGQLERVWTEKGGRYFQDLNFFYNPRGQVNQIIDALRGLTKSYRYDSLDRLISGGYENSNDSFVYGYDGLGNIISAQGPGSPTL